MSDRAWIKDGKAWAMVPANVEARIAQGGDFPPGFCATWGYETAMEEGYTPDEVVSMVWDGVEVPAARIEIAEGDEVLWAAAGKGRVVHVFDATDNQRIAEVEIPGWYFTSGGYFTRTDTGKPAVLEIVAADLTRKVD